TIMASAGAECDHILHVSTQLPYAMTIAVISLFCYIFTGFVRTWCIALPVSIVFTVIVLILVQSIAKGGSSESAPEQAEE
ncbi:MAG: hypothetical protein IIY77_04845, partial [Lachnospiraceae bacterium]|nr:hypothetical protein [Lachnospiraceae bacterium]